MRYLYAPPTQSRLRKFSAALPCIFAVAVSFSATIAPAEARPTEVFVDGIVASVDGQPITLQDVTARLGVATSAPTSLSDLAANSDAVRALDAIIMERVLLAEAENRRVSVTEDDIQRYVDEVAARNGLSQQGLVEALQREGKSLEQYKQQIKFDIVRSKLASNHVKSTAVVTDQEVEEHLRNHPSLGNEGSALKLRRIFLSKGSRSSEEARAQLAAIREDIEDSESFAEMAIAHSEGPEKDEGGSLGTLAEKDLSPEIFDAVFSLEPSQISEIVESDQGVQIFLLEERMSGSSEPDERLREEARKELQAQKFEAKLHSFFTSEILKNHTIEKKL